MPCLRRIALVAATLAMPFAHAHAATQLDHQFFNLDSHHFFFSDASAFCGAGMVAGTAQTSQWLYTGFVTNAQGETSLYSVPGSSYTEIMGCHGSQLMGQTIVNGVRSGFFQDATGEAQLVAPADGTFPVVEGMNAAGTVVGWYMADDKQGVRASSFVISNGVFSRFDYGNKPETRLAGVLDDGTLYGSYTHSAPLRSVGFIWRDGVATELHVAGSYDTVITGMNPSGQVVGYYSEAIGSPYRGFAWKNGKFAKFSLAAEGGATYPMSIDDEGNVTGYISNPDYTHASFVGRLHRSAGLAR